MRQFGEIAMFAVMVATRAGAQGSIGAPAQSPETLLTLRGVVHYANGAPAARALLVVVDSASPRSRRVSSADTLGRFHIDSLHRGVYTLRADYSATESFVERVMVDTGAAGVVDVLVKGEGTGSDWNERLWVAGILVFFFLTIVIWRWHHIARPVHEMLRAQIQSLDARLATEVDRTQNAAAVAALEKQVRNLEDWTEEAWTKPKLSSMKRWSEFFFWSRGRENAAWAEVHEIERQLVAFFTPPAQVPGYLVWIEAEVRALKNNPGALAIADAIKTNLALPTPTADDTRADLLVVRKGLLARALSIINGDRDASFVSLMEWQDKASWLIFVALTIIGLLAGVSGHATLFLVGAAGGFASRLSRAVSSTDVPLDYGASWTTLFLSPVFGALSAWFGTALITLGVRAAVLGPVLSPISWDSPESVPTIAVAFLLGFSERYFDAIVGALANTVQDTPNRPPAGGATDTKNTGATPDVQNAVARKLGQAADASPNGDTGDVVGERGDLPRADATAQSTAAG